MSLAHLYNTTMDVYHIKQERSARSGGRLELEEIKYRDVPCLIDLARQTEREVIGREGVVATHWIFCDTEFEIDYTNVIKIGERVFDVTVADDVQERGHHLENAVIERR